jgi:hypothetical protein
MRHSSKNIVGLSSLTLSAHDGAWTSRLGLGAVGWVRLLLLIIIAGMTLIAPAVGIPRSRMMTRMRCTSRKILRPISATSRPIGVTMTSPESAQ